MASPRSRTRARALFPVRERPSEGPLHGTARLGRRTKDLVKRLRPTDIAVVDHTNIDRISAEELIETGVAAIINVAESSTGRYPNMGPLLLVRAGVRLIDAPGAPLFDLLKDGDALRLEDGRVFANGSPVASGRVLDPEELALQMEGHRERIGDALEAFAENTITHLRQERELLIGRIEFPHTRTNFRDRQVLIVVRGPGYKKDLQALRAYIADVRPVLVGVDGGADALLADGLRPDLILGDMDSASNEALRCGAELIVHSYPDGRAPGQPRLEEMGLAHTVVPAPGTSQDVAMLLAFEKGAELIVTVGAHFNLVEFLERNREGMSSTFLTRLRIGEILVDAKGVGRLYRPGASAGQMGLFLAAFAVLLVIVAVTSPVLDNFLELLWLKIRIVLDL